MSLDEKVMGKHHDKNIFIGIQTIRAFACLAIMFCHTSLGNGHGAIGVHCFFVISGFVTMLSTEKGMDGYWKKRISKIIPLYYFMTIIISIILYFAPFLFRSSELRCDYFFKSLLFIPYNHNGINGPIMAIGWTLNYEMFFYACFYLCSTICHPKRGVIYSIVATILTFIGTIKNKEMIEPFAAWCNPIVLEFAIGIFIYIVYQKGLLSIKESYNGNAISFLWITYVTITLILMVMIEELMKEVLGAYISLVEGIIAGIMLAFSVCVERLLRGFGIIVLFGNLSYIVYLTHYYIIKGIDYIGDIKGLSKIITAFIGIVFAITASLLGYEIHNRVKEYINESTIINRCEKIIAKQRDNNRD